MTVYSNIYGNETNLADMSKSPVSRVKVDYRLSLFG